MTADSTYPVAPAVRVSWERFVEIRRVAESTQRYEDGEADAGALFDFLGEAGGITRLLCMVGPLIVPGDPITAMLWRLASRCRNPDGVLP